MFPCVTRRLITVAAAGLLSTLPVACSSDDAAPQEPVAADGATPDAAADAAKAPDGDSGAPAQSEAGAEQATPAGSDQAKTDEQPAETEKPAAAKPEDGQTVGELTDHGQPAGGQPDAAAQGEQAPPPSQEAPVESDALQGAFQDQQQPYANGPASGSDGMAASSGKAGKHHHGGKATAGSGKSVRYVNATMLNVRAKPSTKAAIVRRLLGGSEVHVTIKGKWAMIKKGQWVRSKYLSEQPTQKVSKHEADGAWRQARHKAKGKKHKHTAHKETAPAEPQEAPAPEQTDFTQPVEGQ